MIGHDIGRLRATLQTLLEHPQADRRQVGVDLRVNGSWRAAGAVPHQLRREPARFIVLERTAAGQHFIEHDSQAVDITGRNHGRSSEAGQFGRDIRQRSDNYTAARQPRHRIVVVLQCQSEISQDRFAATVDHEIAGLQIAMNDSLGMRRLQRPGRMQHESGDLGRWPGLGRLLQQQIERLAFDVLHRDERESIHGPFVINLTDIRVLELLDQTGLAKQSLHQFARAIAPGIGNFEGDLAIPR